jgi:hypothetical protein
MKVESPGLYVRAYAIIDSAFSWVHQDCGEILQIQLRDLNQAHKICSEVVFVRGARSGNWS